MSSEDSITLIKWQDSGRRTPTEFTKWEHKVMTETEENVTSSLSPRSTAKNEIRRLQDIIQQLQNELTYLQNENGSGFDNATELRWKLHQCEKEKLELATKFNEEVSKHDSQIAKLRSQLEKGEAVRQSLEYELALARKEAGIERYTSEDRIEAMNKINEQLEAQHSDLQQQIEDLEIALQITQQAREGDQRGFLTEVGERDKIIQQCNTENELLTTERNRLDSVLQEQEETLKDLQNKLKELELERNNHTEVLRQREGEIQCSAEREERLQKELELAKQKIKNLEENIEAERAAHLESKFNSEIIQLRVRDLEGALQVEKASQAEALSNLEMIKQMFRDVENEYEKEKRKAQEYTEKLKKLENDSNSTKKQLTGEIENKKKLIGELSHKLQSSENIVTGLRGELATAKNHHAALEETYGGSMRELELLLNSFAVSGPRTSGNHKDKDNPPNPSAVLETLRHTLTDYQSRLEDTSNELEKVKSSCAKMTEECESHKTMVWSQNKKLEETKEKLVGANKELSHLHAECAEKEALIGAMKMELQNLQHFWEKERVRATEAENEIQKFSLAYQKDTEEKLTFLHDLYQRLVAGCVLIKQPEGMLGKFSWPELCTVLQENVDALTSDLNKANEKLSHLEFVCKNKADTIKELQQTQEDTFRKLAEQMKERENSWQKQKKELEQNYSGLLGNVHIRAQKCQEVADEYKEMVTALEKIRDHLALENSHFKSLLSQTQKEHRALFVACALMAGALYPLYRRACVLSLQKEHLQEEVRTFESVKNEIKTLAEALSGEDQQDDAKRKKKHLKKKTFVFRKGVIAVLAANRLRQLLGQSSNHLFTWMENFKESTGLLVCAGRSRIEVSHSGQQKEQNRNLQALSWFTSSDLLTAVVSSVADLQELIRKTDPNSPSSGRLLMNEARSSFSKLMDSLSLEMDGVLLGTDRLVFQENDSLIQRLGHGLHKINTKALSVGLTAKVTIKRTVLDLQKHILEFTQRLHTAEVERRSLRMELSEVKRNASLLKKEANKALSLEEQLKEIKHAKMVPLQKFESVYEELSNALQREDQAQVLLNEQAYQLQELNFRLELRSNEEAEKDQTLAEAVKSLSEAKMELRRKDQSLRQLNKHLTQLEQDKRRLEESIHDAESALHMAAKDKELVANYMKSIEANLHKVRDQILLSRTAATRNDFTLQLPRLHMETFLVEGLKGGPEVAAYQNLIQSFVEIYQLACSRIAALETEIASHQKHIAVLKSELQTACLRENESLLPVFLHISTLLGLANPVSCRSYFRSYLNFKNIAATRGES
ncbi:coiled-coil domain-containing protein 171 isoform X2 [Latimeria chalumnae]|uniref:coiled-coil domain-containing protein 171 isoform X2 n=1 Tax=Latimeria chalumnae TaxID=7897 RepID=UPI00313D5CB9